MDITNRTPQFQDGFRAGMRNAIRITEAKAKEMKDANATSVLNAMAYDLGRELSNTKVTGWLARDLERATSRVKELNIAQTESRTGE